MHEMPVTEQILTIVLEHAQKAQAKRVVKVNLVIGALTQYSGESVQFYFDLLSKGTEAEKASLHISRSPAKARCKECKTVFNPDGIDWLCPQCGGLIEDVVGGREFYVESIEIE
jgi:hydrogenase nickel incorporation protein HypA/HybF